MKRMVCILTALAVILISCKTLPEPPPPFSSQEEIDKAFEDVYNDFKGELIMDGAVNYTVQGGENYLIKRGDTLTKIAGSSYGNGNIYYFPIIMLASFPSEPRPIRDPDLIYPDMILKIPNLRRNLDNPGARESIKSYLGEIAGLYDRKGVTGDDEERKKAARDTAEKLRDLAKSL